MTSTISFHVPGEARGKARPRVTQHGGHTYTPDPGGWAASVTAAATVARDDPALAEYTGPVGLSITVDRAMPKSWSNKKKQAMSGMPCLSTPDSVNVAAAIMDALNHVLYKDDKQVADLSISQSWRIDHGTWTVVMYTVAL